ncbi:MAG: galactose mutarotase [Pirellulales bacterium]|nr:galactose mutarotase [Pirellulales bacterium]
MPTENARIEQQPFGATAGGEAVVRYTLRNANGLSASLINFGAAVTELNVPDRQGKLDDIVLGFDNLGQYETQSPYFGCVVGRVAFRIPGGRFELDGRTYQLELNRGEHHLHGGTKGFSWVVWRAEPLEAKEGPAVRFSYHSPDGDQGYPGNLDAAVVYSLTDRNELKIDYTATADRPTPVNLTHHGYFNLAGAGSGDVLDHVVWINADHYTPTDAAMTPTGEIAPVAGTVFDLRKPLRIGDRHAETGGFDLAYLQNHAGGSLELVARVEEPSGERVMEVLSTAPAVIFYTGKWLPERIDGKRGQVYKRFGGLCVETGHLPGSVHHKAFPSTILRPGQTYRQTCVYRFSTKS